MDRANLDKVWYALLIAALVVGNGFLNCSPANLLLSVPQFLIVLYYALRKKYSKAVLLHIIFIVTSFSYNLTDRALDVIGVSSLASYNYAKFKIASIPLFFINNVIIVFLLLINKYKVSRAARRSDFYQFFRFLRITFLIGVLLALPGLIFFDYFLEGFITYGSYVFFLLTTSYLLLLLYSTDLVKQLYDIIPLLICISIIFSMTANLLGVSFIGEVYATYFTAILLPYSLYNKKAVFALIILMLYMITSVAYGIGGKNIIQFILLFIAVGILTFNHKVPVPKSKLRSFRLAYLLIIISIPIILATFVGADSNFFFKLHGVKSLFGFFFGGRMLDIDRSPYIRVAEVANVLYEDLLNPIYMFFGRGFGGYYQDRLGLFYNVDISFDTFSAEQLVAKRYYTAHDAFVSVPMVNGLVGTYFWLRTIYIYLKHATRNYLKLVVIPFLLLVYYFDSQIGVMGTVMMFAAEARDVAFKRVPRKRRKKRVKLVSV